ncbi:ribosome-associated translation inhibitor RaiA [Stenotrophomonas maltophilia]|uniref:ribosome hibernation-promoting factor, HPF/YfiA family n=1 Tax=Stenotrophomonas maltophilia TaxID=40324 RepID=UPI002ACD06EC|nr:ribosome-associated translation inhibitor RaiA [Stenotrophomonas maltophilia]MDZ5817641.1 ribosome-associated translation inhibitor RaiA [Stenotrophomonas maltophilia]
MRIETFGKDVEVTPALQSYVEEKLARIGKHFDQHCEARVTLKLQKTEHHVDASLNIPGQTLHAEAGGQTMYAAIGHGIAIPHGRAPTLDRPRGALLRLATPVDFGGDEPVDLVFAMAVPAHYTHQHLMLLSELAELFSAPGIRQALRAAGDARALRQALELTPPASAA